MPFRASGAAFFISGTNEETFGMSKDQKENLSYKPAIFRDRNKDLSKEWYIEWYSFDEATNHMVRKRKKIQMAYQDIKDRTNPANILIAKINRLLAKGYHFKPARVTSNTDLPIKSNDLVNV